ncbi:MAG TPA: MarR family transcriptional regulator [Spirochaetia bacterium]|nr:MarR family transcriptional regulator [Spirochaetia bacterium]
MSKVSDGKKTTAQLAVELMVGVSRLRHSKPAKRRDDAANFSVPQLLLLRRIEEVGETTAAQLAVSEHVSQQAIAQNLAALKAEGFVESTRDPNDERKNPVHVTEAGKLAINSYLARRTKWLAKRIESRIDPTERAELERAIELLERLSRVEDELEGEE